MDDKELERLAQEELLKEAERGKLRAETMGAMGWQKCPVPTANKRFLSNVIKSTLEPRKKKSKAPDTAKEHCQAEREFQNSSEKHKRNKKKSHDKMHSGKHRNKGGKGLRKHKHKTRHKSKDKRT